jgi:hypothetical protein
MASKTVGRHADSLDHLVGADGIARPPAVAQAFALETLDRPVSQLSNAHFFCSSS